MSKFYIAGILALVLLIGIASASSTSYIHANGQIIAKVNGSGVYYYHTDRLGSTSAMTNETGEVIEEQVNLPFGQPVSGSEKYGFTGKEHDETELMYFGARYYKLSTGRFINVDPIKDGINWYSYVENNPLTRVDPDGRSWTESMAKKLGRQPQELRLSAERRLGNLVLRPGEYILPSVVLKAFHKTLPGTGGEGFGSPGGGYIDHEHVQEYFKDHWYASIPFIETPKERFHEFLSEHSDHTKGEIDAFLSILTKKGNIVLAEGEKELSLFHERMHKVMSESLTTEERNVLFEAANEFVGWMVQELKSSPDGHCLYVDHIAPMAQIGILQVWQEPYTYMGQAQEYPTRIGYFHRVDPIVIETFKQRHPEAYNIYREVVEEAKGM